MNNSKIDQDRRRLLRSAALGAAGVAAGSLAVSPATARAASSRNWHREADIVVAGSGSAALTAALVAAKAGAKVLVLEKGPITGGTTRKSGGVFWIPNHYGLREQGIDDNRADCLQYLCRMAYPELYRPDSDTLGLAPDAYALLEAFYDHGYPMVDTLRDWGALNIAPFNMWHLQRPAPDYQGHLKENKVPSGRALGVLRKDGSDGSGSDFIDQLEAACVAAGVEVLTDHGVSSLITNSAGEIIGAEVDTEDGPIQVRSRKAVIFGTGGYVHNLEYVRQYQRSHVYGSCAVPTATGDFITIAGALGARIGNTGSAWRSQALIEETIVNRSLARCVDMLPGDSMFMVNKYGVRVVNEKRNYNDRTEVHLTFDPNQGEFPNQLLFMIYDQRTAELYGGSHPLPLTPEGSAPVIKGDTLEQLSAAIAARLDKVRAHIGNVRLADDFSANLQETFDKFNTYARQGVDAEFQRGDTDYDRAFGLFFQPARQDTKWPADHGMPNSTLCPLTAEGPYYAMILGAGALDTNGGPVVDENARVLNTAGQPIPGLYGAGNCIASPSREAYFGPGGTIGPAMTFGYIAARHAVQEPVKEA